MVSAVLVLAASLFAGDVHARPARSESRSAPATAAPATPAPSELFSTERATFLVNDAFVGGVRAINAQLATTVMLGDGDVIAIEVAPFALVPTDVTVHVGHGPISIVSPALSEALRGVTHLRGHVVGEPGSAVYLAAGSHGLAGFVDRGPGRARYTLRRSDGESRGLLSGEVRFDRSGGTSQPPVPLCATEDEGGGVAGFGALPPGVTPRIEIAVDTDFDFFDIFDDEVAATEYVAALYGAIATIYERDMGATIALVYLRLATDPNDLFNAPDPLYEFKDWWNANMGDVHRDIAQLLTGRRDLPYGGVAWLSAACSEIGYSVNGYLIGGFADPHVPDPGNWDLIVVAHELGHNVGTSHTHSYGLDSCNAGAVQRGSIMSYCHVNSGATANIDLRFHRVCADAIESYLAKTPCIGSDCDSDGIEDVDAIAAGSVPDLNADGIPDGCQDCDGDGVLDPEAISTGLVADADLDGRPDACEQDCNGNGVPDSLDIALGTSTDAYGDGIPDECEPDCDGNGIADYSDIQADMFRDRGRDALIDSCQDCDGDGIDDFSELGGSGSIWVGNATAPEVRELHPRSGVVMNVIPLSAVVYDLVIGPDGHLYASAGRAIWRIDRVARAVLGKAYEFPEGVVTRGMAFRSDGVLLVATNVGGVHMIDVAQGTALGQFAPVSAGDARDVFVRPSGTVLVSYSTNQVFQFTSNGNSLGPFISMAPTVVEFLGIYESEESGVLVVSRSQRHIYQFNAATGAFVGIFDVQPGSMLTSPWGLAGSADGRAVLAPSSNSSSTVNGYNLGSGYLERTYRVYPDDAPGANAIVVAPYAAPDLNGNLIPDSCEAPSADLNGDGVVDGADLAMLIGSWGTAAADLNGDGTTDGADLSLLLAAWTA